MAPQMSLLWQPAPCNQHRPTCLINIRPLLYPTSTRTIGWSSYSTLYSTVAVQTGVQGTGAPCTEGRRQGYRGQEHCVQQQYRQGCSLQGKEHCVQQQYRQGCRGQEHCVQQQETGMLGTGTPFTVAEDRGAGGQEHYCTVAVYSRLWFRLQEPRTISVREKKNSSE